MVFFFVKLEIFARFGTNVPNLRNLIKFPMSSRVRIGRAEGKGKDAKGSGI